jgi:hypothetical protein
MPDDGFQITTSTAAPLIGNDTLIRGLVAEWRSANAADAALFEAANKRNDDVGRELRLHSDMHESEQRLY